jgi:hypothetical protein
MPLLSLFGPSHTHEPKQAKFARARSHQDKKRRTYTTPYTTSRHRMGQLMSTSPSFSPPQQACTAASFEAIVSVIEGGWGQQPVATELLERSFEHRLRHVGLPFLRQLLPEEGEDVPRRG